ncbi:hypothetical protein QR680_010991 [Steinernema hermaphroditum]|uniref:Nematode cuticle collagen N-terminal domain-containing protein n=1 Tax=Steinernema hermaphroditum TaxID=289476 RepID=A0AA39MBK3_9BILA|nr:hypothetical protein QR680_010991 [Steinernema hermaphroditum]
MTKHLRAVVGVATTASTLAVVVALFVGLSLYHDVNDMYDEVISDLGEFKTLANDAWKGIMNRRVQTIPMLILRHRRQTGSGCSK